MPPLDGLDVVLVSIAADLDDAHAAAKRASAEGRTAAGIVAAAIDFFLVRIQRDTLYEFTYQQKGSPLTKFLQLRSVHNDNWLSELCKAPFDHVDLTDSGATVPGLSGRTHRMHTLG